VVALLNGDRPVHQHEVDTAGELVRLAEGRMAGDPAGVEDDNVGGGTGAQHTAVGESDPGGRRRSAAADGVAQVAGGVGVPAEVPGEAAVASGMRHARPRYAVGIQ
jgi:hypothetical protein